MLAWPRLYVVDAGYPLNMGPKDSDDRQTDAVLAALVGQCLDLIQGAEPQGLHLRSDATMDGFRWLTVGPKDQPDLNILLARPQPPMFSE